jgi:hypothetical protein
VGDNITGKRREVLRWQIERNGEVVRKIERKERERGPLHPLPHYLSLSFSLALPPSSQSSSLPLSFLLFNSPPHYFSPRER